MKFLTFKEKGGVRKHHDSSFQKGLGWVIKIKCSIVLAQNVRQGLKWIWCCFWKWENTVTWSTSLGNIFWSFLICKVIYIPNESWNYLVFTKIQQYIPPWKKFLHIIKTIFFIYFSQFFHSIWHPFQPPYLN